MNGGHASVKSELIASVQPVVLVGGKSTRFGRDKLLEPCSSDENADRLLVDVALDCLRQVFGCRVCAVGECDPRVRERADQWLPDGVGEAGAGPLSGIVAALEHFQTDVFVLSGDLPRITDGVVRRVLDSAAVQPQASAVLARSKMLEPCIGVYRMSGLDRLLTRLRSNERKSLHDVFDPGDLLVVDVALEDVANVNTPEELRRIGCEE